MRWALIFAVYTAMSGAVPAQSLTVFSESFDSENGGVSAENYTAYSSIQYRFGTPSYDLVRNGDGGVFCRGASGSCLALNADLGVPNGELITRNSFAFSSGDIVTLSIYASGDQLGGQRDELGLGFAFSDNLRTRDARVSGGFGNFVVRPGVSLSAGFGWGDLVDSLQPFQLYALSFEAVDSGLVRPLLLAGYIGDAFGPIIDDFALDIRSPAGVSEPANWALMVAGLGFLGGAIRARRRSKK